MLKRHNEFSNSNEIYGNKKKSRSCQNKKKNKTKHIFGRFSPHSGVDTFPQISLTLPQRAASPHSIAAKQFEPDTAQQRAVDAEVKKQKQMAAYANQTPRPVPTTTTPRQHCVVIVV